MRTLAFIAIALSLLAVWGVFDTLTRPPDMPDYQQVRASWKPSYAELLDRNGKSLGETRENFHVRRMDWVRYDDLSAAARKVFVLAEDKRFYRHNGVDWLALIKATLSNPGSSTKRGASTITMQLAGQLMNKNGHHGRRGIRAKLVQMRAARMLESQWTKAQILESWLNLVSFSGEVQGIGAASRLIAGKPPSALTQADSLQLAAEVPAPAASASRMQARACAISQRLPEPVDCSLLAGLNGNLPSKNRWHAYHVRQILSGKAGSQVHSTIDDRLQTKSEDILAKRLKRLHNRNVRDGAILVADNATGNILVWVGSNPDSSRSPYVDGVTAKRQAGSSLKPQLYALAMQEGLISPASVLDDSPLALESGGQGIYAPQNYDRQFVGPVSARMALGNSMNIPAIRTLILTGIQPFMDRLTKVGYSGLTEDPDYYGFALALGSVEVSLYEQVRAYMMLANNGEWQDLHLQPGQTGTRKQIVSPQAAFQVADMLADDHARVHTFGRNSVLHLPFPASVKTGTSKAMRDNWAVGFTTRYTVGVWVGNFEGDPMTGVSGISGAAPIWHDVMMLLHEHNPPAARVPPKGVTQALVKFDPPIEASREEWFRTGHVRHVVHVVTKKDRLARIVAPVDGSIFAIDPDIPPANQQMIFQVDGKTDHLALRLDGKPWMRNAAWFPVPGKHKLELVSSLTGKVLDHASFSVR